MIEQVYEDVWRSLGYTQGKRSALEQLREMTGVVVDSGDFHGIQRFG